MQLIAVSPNLPKAEVLIASLVSNTRAIAIPRSANFRYLDYSEGACSRCNHPLRAGDCPKHPA